MSATSIGRDERTIAVEHASYRWGYLFLAFGLLVVTAYRAFSTGDSSWELLGLVVLSGLVTTTFQLRQRALTRRTASVAALALIGALVVAAVLVYALRAYGAAAAGYDTAASLQDASPR